MPFIPLGPEPHAGRRAGATAALIAVMGFALLSCTVLPGPDEAEVSGKIREVITISNAHPQWKVRASLQKLLAGQFSAAAPWGRADVEASDEAGAGRERFDRLQADLMSDLEELPLMKYGFVPARRSWFTFVTGPLVHAGFWHLLVNAVALWWAGAGVETRFGARAMLLLFGAGALFGELAYLFADPYSPVPLVGASGGAAALFAGFAILAPSVRFRFLSALPFGARFGVPVIALALLWAVFQIALQQVSGATSLSASTHLGGFAAGLVLGALLLWRHRRKESREDLSNATSRIPIWVYPPPFVEPSRTLFLVGENGRSEPTNDAKKPSETYLDSSPVNR